MVRRDYLEIEREVREQRVRELLALAAAIGTRWKTRRQGTAEQRAQAVEVSAPVASDCSDAA